MLCLSYGLLNYCWSTADFDNLISYDFLRNDGAMLISYNALAFFLGWPLKVAFAGLAETMNLPYSSIFAPLGVIGEDRAEGGGDMFVGWFRAHNTAGGIYAIASVLALAFLLETGMKWKEKLFRWSLFLTCLVGLVQTYSRGAYIGFVAGAAVVFPLRKLRQDFRIGLMIGVSVLLLIVTNNSLITRLDTITDSYYGNNVERVVLWKEALKDFADSPFIGMGYGRYNDVGLQYWGSKGIL